MARLSVEVLEEGRGFVRQKDLEGLVEWTQRHGSRDLNYDVFIRGFEDVFRNNNERRALLMFDRTFSEMDPTVDALVYWLTLAFKVVLGLGAVGGLVYLFRSF